MKAPEAMALLAFARADGLSIEVASGIPLDIFGLTRQTPCFQFIQNLSLLDHQWEFYRLFCCWGLRNVMKAW